VAARHRTAVFEPEVEEVAVHDQLVARLWHRVQEGMERPGDRLGDLPEVGIGHDETARGRGWHGPKL
jgi:hypothetical protein